MYRLYNFPPSGNCYKLRLLLTQLQIPFELISVNLLNQETRLPEFLQKNPSGKVPVLEIEPHIFLTESNSILLYLSEETDFFPVDQLEKNQVFKWLFFEQFSLGANLSRPRFWISILKQPEKFTSLISYHQGLGKAGLEVMEKHLADHSFFVGERYTIADIALYSYSHMAHQGGYDMSQFPKIQEWCDRVASQPNYITIVE